MAAPRCRPPLQPGESGRRAGYPKGWIEWRHYERWRPSLIIPERQRGHFMIISDVRTTAVRVPWVDPPRFAPVYDLPREILIVEIETRSGIVGMGYLQPLGGGLATLDACIREVMVPRLIGRAATAVEAIWDELWRATSTMGR